jgi:HK97 family phage major capsid protein
MRGVLQRIEQQIIGGNGSGENLRGLMNTSGVLTPSLTGLANSPDKILEGAVALLDNGAQPNDIVLNSHDWADSLRLKASGSGEYLSPGPFAGQIAERLWNIPSVPTAAIPRNSVLIGDFALACTVLFRDGVQVLASDSDQDTFVRNQITLLGESRVAFPVWQPGAVAVVSLA